MNDGKKGRRRRSSSLLYQEPPESMEHINDQLALPNLNADWVNAKGESPTFSFIPGPALSTSGIFIIMYNDANEL
jgi:hypothetical protein